MNTSNESSRKFGLCVLRSETTRCANNNPTGISYKFLVGFFKYIVHYFKCRQNITSTQGICSCYSLLVRIREYGSAYH